MELVTIADLKIRGVRYKIVSDLKAKQVNEETKRTHLQANVLREDKENEKFVLVTNNDERVAVWQYFQKLYKKGIEEGKINPQIPADGKPHAVHNEQETTRVNIKQTHRYATEEEIKEIEAKNAKKSNDGE